MLLSTTVAKAVAAIVIARVVGTRRPQVNGLPRKGEIVREFHSRLQNELPRPVELWGVRVASRGSRLPDAERAVLASFLRARDWSVDEATYMLTSSLKWRKEFGVEQLRGSQFGDLPRELVSAGRDSKGRLLVVLRLGELGGECFNDMDRFVRWRVYMQEALNAQLNFAQGDPKYTLVLNCEGFCSGHFSKAARRCAKELARVSQDNYPDFLSQILICNPPAIFAFAFGVLRPFLPRNFVKMIRVHIGDEASCLAQEGHNVRAGGRSAAGKQLAMPPS